MKYFILIFVLMLIGCSSKNTSSTSPGLGHWVDTYPSEFSIWQCVEPYTPFKNKEC